MSGWKNWVARMSQGSFMAKHLLVAALMLFFGQSALADECPEYPGQTHEEIIYKIEGRLNGDWKTIMTTVQKSIARLRSEGKDSTDASLYYSVLHCLERAIRDGLYSDVILAARGKTKPMNAQSGQETQTSEEPVESAPATPEVTEAPAATPAPDVVPVEAPPGTQQSFEPIIIDSGGVVTPAPAPAPAPALAQVASVPPGGYVGQMCAFFTRPLDEVINGVSYHNVYGEGAWVCHAGQMYACQAGVWADKGICSQYNKWETRQSQVLEAR